MDFRKYPVHRAANVFSVFTKKQLVIPMKVSGTISSIIRNKGDAVWDISPDATVFDAIQMMADKNVGALLVTENGKLLGIISERDYTRKVAIKGKSSKQTPVREIITSEPVTASPSDSIEDCMREMTTHRVRHLPILEEGKIVGIVSIGDLVNWTISAMDVAIDQLENYIHGNPA